jgi:hypothetical protein
MRVAFAQRGHPTLVYITILGGGAAEWQPQVMSNIQGAKYLNKENEFPEIEITVIMD